MHNCPDCGIEHEAPEPEVLVEEAVDVEPIADANVEVARIEAERDVTIAKISAKMEERHDETEIEVLRAELRALRDLITPPEPEPEPTPVVIEEPEPVPVEEEMPPREERHEPKAPASKRGFF